ncbi:uncharacterized protein [Ptychodera flava]|uniref:uncharacterized protein n=1 Tax=Ptychodera flava TaxID=63121 RepID=UPI00396A1004
MPSLRCMKIILISGLSVFVVVSILAYGGSDYFTSTVKSIVTKFNSLVTRSTTTTKHDSGNVNFPVPSTIAPNLAMHKNESKTIKAGSWRNIHKVTGASTKQGKEFGYLKPYDHFVVPNLVHFIWFSCHPFKFGNLISMLSVHRIMKAESIHFYTDCEPSGEWWDEAKNLIPTLKVINRTRPLEVFNKTLNPRWPEHSADVARLQILLEQGGVYLDLDVIVVAPLEPLRYYEYVVGRSDANVLANGVIFANKSSKFLRLYYENYKNYNRKCWGCSSVKYQHRLAEEHKDLLHIEPDSLIKPNNMEWKQLFLENYNWREGHFTIHVWFRRFRRKNPKARDFTSDNVKQLNSTLGELCRYIYYGNPDIIE